MKTLTTLLREVRRCEICSDHLPAGPRPILSAHESARILVIGQAPGRRVHDSGIPWDDPSGDRLREWLGVTSKQFYDPKQLALVPMGFCYPGKGSSGDLPPKPECAGTWHDELLERMPRVNFTVLLSQYAHARYVPLPHPSPRNNIWLKKNPWFAEQVLPYLRRRVKQALR